MKKQAYPFNEFCKNLSGSKTAKNPAEEQTQPEAPPSAPRIFSPPSLFAGVVIGFLLRLLTEAVKLFLIGG